MTTTMRVAGRKGAPPALLRVAVEMGVPVVLDPHNPRSWHVTADGPVLARILAALPA